MTVDVFVFVCCIVAIVAGFWVMYKSFKHGKVGMITVVYKTMNGEKTYTGHIVDSREDRFTMELTSGGYRTFLRDKILNISPVE